MTNFIDGPAEGKTLMLKRSPIYLRVAVDFAGEVDGLDQIGDRPRIDETLHAYRLAGVPGMVHIHRSGGRGGFYPMSQYKLVPTQPDDATMRDTARWQEWCRQQIAVEPFQA